MSVGIDLLGQQCPCFDDYLGNGLYVFLTKYNKAYIYGMSLTQTLGINSFFSFYVNKAYYLGFGV